MTFRALFFPFRSTITPLESSTWSEGGVSAPSRSGMVGFIRSPPSAHAMASMTDVFPWPFFPPITVSPVSDGVSATARTRFTFRWTVP